MVASLFAAIVVTAILRCELCAAKPLPLKPPPRDQPFYQNHPLGRKPLEK